jgi:transglutaminase-like putative cysteine protease
MTPIQLRAGYRISYDFVAPTPMMVTLAVHYSRASDLVTLDHLTTTPSVPIRGYRDGFGNWVNRIVAPAGRFQIASSAVLRDHGQPDPVFPLARQQPIEDLPEEVLVYLLGSRYCDTDRLSDIAWNLFASAPAGWGRVQAICDFVHDHITFSYMDARSTRTAFEAYQEGIGVCRDFAHLAVALCRCMNIPARYCTGYIAEIGVPVSSDPMDFSAWFEAWLEGGWHIFDARHNVPRIGRVLIAIGRDATDVPISHTFGANTLVDFDIWCDQVT